VAARRAIAAAVVAGSTALLAGCGDGGASANLSEQAAHGRRIANRSGCAACHGADGQGGVGPAFVGLYGSRQELEDGTTVLADEAYLSESISDPDAKIVAGYSQRMPDNGLDDDEIADVVQYIRELTEPAGTKQSGADPSDAVPSGTDPSDAVPSSGTP
jgi:cytochrome c oxidase subunit II